MIEDSQTSCNNKLIHPPIWRKEKNYSETKTKLFQKMKAIFQIHRDGTRLSAAFFYFCVLVENKVEKKKKRQLSGYNDFSSSAQGMRTKLKK